tara:strand:- start:12 stop:266 length:255 start_codon:yes stop_codon:yes gene_type:complete
MRLYEAYTKQSQREEETTLISDALQRGQLTGTKRFYDEVEQRIGIRVEQRKQGRPKKIMLGELKTIKRVSNQKVQCLTYPHELL